MFRNWKLTRKFVTVFLLLITLPTLVFGGFIYYQTSNTFKQQAEINALERLEKNEDNLTSIIQSIENMSSYMIYDENFRAFFRASEQEIFQPEYKQAIAGINGYFTFQLMSHSFIDSIYLESKDGNRLEIGSRIRSSEQLLDEAAKAREGAPQWSGTYRVEREWESPNEIISLTRVINDINHISEAIGMVRIRLDQSKFYHSIEKDASFQGGSYFVVNKTGDVVLHPNSALAGKPYPEAEIVEWVANSPRKTMKYHTSQTEYLVVKKPIEGTNWVSIAMVNEGEVVKNLDHVRQLFAGMVVLLILLGTVALIGFYSSFIKRIVELTEQTRQLEKGDFSANVQVTSQDEIGKLGMRFNQMVVTIQSFINREYKLKIKQRESELKALQSQIDPHFLYNTLDMIRWTARLENAMETGQLIERLSKIFRMNLNMGKMWVKLEEEFVYIQNYLELQKSRLGNRLNYRLFYDDQIKDVLIMKQLVQPLVENSILHGFKNLPRQGIITIRAYQAEEEIWMDVIDNGWGFSDERVKEREGYALKNLRERLATAFGEGAILERVPVEQGAWIRLKIPLKKNNHLQPNSNESGERHDL